MGLRKYKCVERIEMLNYNLINVFFFLNYDESFYKCCHYSVSKLIEMK